MVSKVRKIITILMTFSALYGCTAIKTAIAMTQSTDGFILHSDKNGLIYKEIEYSPLAEEAEKYLQTAINTVEKMQYRKFIKPVAIYVVSNLDNFESYCSQRMVLGCCLEAKVYLSPRILTQPNGTLPRLLTHELSHLHFDQQLSVFEWSGVPVWFREGLAVYVSTKTNGAEMDFDEARKQIKEGKSFYPNEKESLFFAKSNASFGISRSIFYRQAGSFVQFLHDNNEMQFESFLLAIQEKENFSASFKKYYGVSISAKWAEFVEKL